MSLVPDAHDPNRKKELERMKQNPVAYDANFEINKPQEAGIKTDSITIQKRKYTKRK